MAESFIQDTNISISKEIESAYNAITSNDPDDHFGLPTSEAFFGLPQVEPYIKEDQLGHEFPTNVCKNYWSHAEFSIAEDIETKICARILRWALSGNPTLSAVAGASGAFDHSFAMKPKTSGRQLVSFNVTTILDAADFLMHGVCVEKFRAEQKRSERAKYKADCIGSGKFTTPSGFASNFPVTPEIPCMSGTETEIKYTGPGGLVTLTGSTRIRSWFVELTNNLKKDDRCLGDPLQDGAAHVRKLLRGKRTVEVGLTLVHDGLSEWNLMKNNDVLTDLTITVKGPVIVSAARQEVSFIVPKLRVISTTPGEDDGDAVVEIGFVVEEDPVTLGGLRGRVRNNESAVF